MSRVGDGKDHLCICINSEPNLNILSVDFKHLSSEHKVKSRNCDIAIFYCIYYKLFRSKMICRITILFACVAVLLIVAEAKPHTDKKGRSVYQLKLSKSDLDRGVAIQINSRRNTRLNHPILSKKNKIRTNIPNDLQKFLKGRRTNRIPKLKQMKEFHSKKTEDPIALNLTTDGKPVQVPTVQNWRQKRHAIVKEKSRDQDKQIDEMENFNKVDDKMTNDYFSDEDQDIVKQSKKNKHSKPQTEPQDYNDYAFDKTDNDQFNDDDEMLRRYYNHPAVRRAVYDDFNTFSDLMHVAAENNHDKRFVKRLHYGQENFMNDNVDDDFSNEYDNNKSFDDDYESSDDYWF